MKPIRISLVVFTLLAILLMSSSPALAQVSQDKRPARLTPVVLIPGWGATRLKVEVRDQSVVPECPRSGIFEYTLWAQPNTAYTQVCADKLLTMVYKFDKPNSAPHVSDKKGVRVTIEDYGKTESAPWYEGLYAFLELTGYTRNLNLRVAGYDFRLNPDMGGFMERTTTLIEETYRENHNTPVHLIAHSNGPIYAQYLLTHTSQQWKNKYIQGYTPIAANLPGQGGMYYELFTGFNIATLTNPADLENAASSAAMYESHPSTYLTISDPTYFGDREVVIRVGPGGKEYTPKDARKLFKDAGLRLAEKIAPYYWGSVKFKPPFFPNVDVYAEKGSGLDTVVGIELPSLKVGQLIDDTTVWITMDGDGNQENITNDSILVWQAMPCYHFELNDNPGAFHMELPNSTPAVQNRLLAHLQQQRSVCPVK